MVKVSVAILSYNRKDDLRETILEIKKSNLKVSVEIIIADNASTDGTVEMLENEFKDVILIKLKENIGVKAYNYAFKRAKGKYILILDDDSFPEQNSIQRMIEEFENDDSIGILAFDVRNYYEYKNISKEIKTKKKEIKYLMGFNGAGAGFRKSLFDEIGGYPEEFFLYWNETDLAIRVLNAGYKISEFSDIISFHKYAPSNRTSIRGPFYYTRNLYWIYWKYFPFFSMFTNTVKMLYSSIYHSFEQRTTIYIKASFAAFFGIKKLKRYRVKKDIINRLRISAKLAFIILR